MNGALLDRLAMKAQALEIPIEVLFEVTHRCNLPCKHCYLPDHENHGELSLAEIESLFDDLARAGTVFLTLTGGEVLSRSDFLEILSAAKQRGFAPKILTNATMVTDEVAAHFVDAGVLDVSVSVYGASAEIHDSITDIPGAFVRTMAGIERMRKAGLHVIIKTPMLSLNGAAARDVHQMAMMMNMPCNFDMTITPKNNGDPGPMALALAQGTMTQLMSEAPFNEIFSVNAPEGPGPGPCNAGRAYCAIGPTGDVLPCIMMPAVLGNVRDRSFHEIWHGHEVLKQLRAIEFEDLHECRSCDVKGSCTRCPGLAMHRGQGMDGCDLSAKQVARARHAARLRVIQ